MKRFPAFRAGSFSLFFLIFLFSSEKASSRGAVCLFDSTDILIKNNLTAEIKVHKSFRVTSTAGSRFADIKIPLNDFIDVSEIKGYTQYPNGKKVRLSQQDIGISSAPGFGGFGGIQVITFSLPNPVVGSKLYFQYKIRIKSLLYLPRLMPRADCPTERITISLTWQSQIKPRFDSEGFNFTSQDSLGAFSQQLQKKDMKFYAENLPEISEEPFSCPMRFHVLFSADRFSYGKSKFNSVSWQEVGYFFSTLSIQPQGKIDELAPLAAKLSSTGKNRNDTLQSFFSFVADSVSYVALQVNKGDFTPHSCDIILSRRFGDCKDQSVLLASLCRAAGFEAYPALIATGDIPEVSALFPWPSWFDHVVTVVKSGDSDIILDPSDRLSGINSIPPRLRGKSYLVCDGTSGLKTIPDGPKPSNAIDWNFELSTGISDNLDVLFNMNYANDASAAYGIFWQNDKTNQGSSFLESQFKYAGWDLTSFSVRNYIMRNDSLSISGLFKIGVVDMGNYRNLSIPSPLSTYLLQNLFPDVRVTDYCNHDSYQLEESIVLDNNTIDILPMTLFSDSWRRAGFEFIDELTVVDGKPEYHRLFEYNGDPLSVADYNAFRDFLLSRKDQQYVRIKK
jgi:hypothetical protein